MPGTTARVVVDADKIGDCQRLLDRQREMQEIIGYGSHAGRID